MADHAQLERIEALLIAEAKRQARIELRLCGVVGLLTSLVAGAQIMTQIATDTKNAVDGLDTKVDNLIAAIGPGVQTLRDELTAAQALIATLQADGAADVTTLQATIASAQAEAAKVDAALAALNPAPVPAPTPAG